MNEPEDVALYRTEADRVMYQGPEGPPVDATGDESKPSTPAAVRARQKRLLAEWRQRAVERMTRDRLRRDWDET